ncbi:4a-hydroxytetrahydrobiopterin dehydratase [Motilimonas eburnea]|uniref:4a-hydroxytetrahydrobiopterin dehydratase n=1 Tax=Motilimonas eburnea TaxID=1737488 RepID=UPI001E410364|nr:4a-hydroxytetrahydrobiopterin dehydratase [Motilimonas eburnea]MCE2570141.1 4a-hydroxytetrahydrobiopterin dehydratase [Motilimonas eburnea]
MKRLSQLNCQPCQGDMAALPEQQQVALMAQLPDWQRGAEQGKPRLSRLFRFKTYAAAVHFTVQLAELSEQADHHPKITLEWGRVNVEWWTHSLDNLHLNDFVMAAHTDQLYQGH